MAAVERLIGPRTRRDPLTRGGLQRCGIVPDAPGGDRGCQTGVPGPFYYVVYDGQEVDDEDDEGLWATCERACLVCAPRALKYGC